jgi:membrane-associated phospholipid phosphatase
LYICLACLICTKIYAGPFTNKNKYGDLFLAGSVFYGYGMISANEDLTGFFQMTGTHIFSSLVTETLKKTVNRPRPNGGNYSFPSGHSTSAFASAAFVHRRYGWKPAIAPYIMSGIVAWSRVDQRAHYWSDVITGAGVGIVSAWLIGSKYDKFQVFATTDSIKVKYSMEF